MSREILFKAKRVDNGEWVEGYLLKANRMDFIFPTVTNGSFDGLKNVMKFINPCFLVNSETICQYTGLTDKKGNKIWENDIVSFPDCDMCTESVYWDVFVNAGKVAYDTESMSYFFTNRVTVDMDDIIIKDEVAVIGNVFDNPELLED